MAGINRFDTPAQAQFINSYVPIPFQEILGAGMHMQNVADTNRAQLDTQLAEADNFKYIDKSADEQYIKQVQSGLRNIVDEYTDKDFYNPEMVREISKKVRSVADRNRIAEIGQSYEGWKGYQKASQEARAKGILIFEDKDFTGYDTEGSGVYSGSPELTLDYRTKKEKYFNNIEADQVTDPKTGSVNIFVNQNKLRKLAQSGADDYRGSSEGQQDIRRYRRDTGITQDQESDSDVAYKLLLAAGQEKALQMNKHIKIGSGKKVPELPDLPLNTLEGPSIDILVDSPYGESEKINFTPNGEIKRRSNLSGFTAATLETVPGKFFNTLKAGVALASLGNSFFGFGNFSKENVSHKVEKLIESSNKLRTLNLPAQTRAAEKIYGDLAKDEELVEQIQQTFESLKYETPQVAVEAYLKGVEKQSSQSLTNYLLPPNIASQASSVLINSIGSRNIQILDQYGRTKVNKKEVLDKLGMKEVDLQNYIKTSNILPISFTQDGDTPGMFIYQIPDKKGRLRDVLVQSDKQVQSATDFSLKLNDAKKTMSPSTIPLGVSDGNGSLALRVEPDIDRDGNVSFNIRNGYIAAYNENMRQDLSRPGTQILESDAGKYVYVPIETLTESQIKQMEMKAILNSISIPAAEKEDIGTVIAYPR